jgi:hypothetical protein
MAYVGRIVMRQSAQLVLLVSLTFFTGAAHAVDRGQFENVPDDVRTWFKGVRSPAGVPCCDISDGHRTEYDVRAGAYWVPINGLWWHPVELECGSEQDAMRTGRCVVVLDEAGAEIYEAAVTK